MKIIHCADIHLDSKLTTHLSGDKLIKRRNEVLLAFEKMVKYAGSHSVTAIIIAGDFFDAKQVSNKTKSIVYDLIKQHSKINFYYVCGNHDENLQALKGLDLPKNLYVFGEEITSFELGNVVVSGVELNHKNYNNFYDVLKLKENVFNIFVMHGQVNAKNVEGIDLARLKNKNINYLALGHLHSFQTGQIDKRGIYAYSGTLEGTGFDDVGEKGFVVLEFSNDTFTYEFVPNSIRAMREINFQVLSNMSLSEQKNALAEVLESVPSKDLVRVKIIGKITPETHIDVNYLLTQFEGGFFYLEIKNNTTLEINPLNYQNDISLKGEFVNLVLGHSNLTDEQKQEILTLGISVILGEEVE